MFGVFGQGLLVEDGGEGRVHDKERFEGRSADGAEMAEVCGRHGEHLLGAE